MDVFALRDQIIKEYGRFSRSFASIKAPDISSAVDEAYDNGRFWPDPLIQLNPHFASGGSIAELVAEGVLDAECEQIFRIKGSPDDTGRALQLHRHQADAIRLAEKRRSYVLTTGTGSGKSLAYFIPIVNEVLRLKKQNPKRRGISAIVVYPMNALCNSQHQELEKYLNWGYGEGGGPVTFARYTGQEKEAERQAIAKNPPDILLTNYVMLELLMTRFVETDKAVREHADGLRYLVLDELHTYRGRQGADVAMLVRRVRERFNDGLICIGTSATMASEGTLAERSQKVANVATTLFGTRVGPEEVVVETLEPLTEPEANPAVLRRAIEQGVPEQPSREHPIAGWVEHNLGLEEREGRLIRISRPLAIRQAAEKLAKDSGIRKSRCKEYLSEFLLNAHQTRDESGRSLFAFRLHQFISGAWNAYATLEPEGERFITTEGQKYRPGDRGRRLFPLCFCRECGQEYFPIRAVMDGGRVEEFRPRDLSDYTEEEEDNPWGYLMLDTRGLFDPGKLEENFPDYWLEEHRGETRIKSSYKRRAPQQVCVDMEGNVSSKGLPGWFIEKSFPFCLNPDCAAEYPGRVGELTKLSALSGEGRSSATTVLTLSSLRQLIGSGLDEQTRKLLAFTDNRQDASLQSGHFNDFILVLLLRAGLLAAIESSPDGALRDDVIAQRVFENLGLEKEDYASSPETKGASYKQEVIQTLRDVIGYRLYFDLQRGWRINNPNLEQLQLLKVGYRDLQECCADQEEWDEKHPLLAKLTPEKRFEIIEELLDRMRQGLCIDAAYLGSDHQDRIRRRSYEQLKEPWGLSFNERLSSGRLMIPRPRKSGLQRDRENLFHISSRSRFGRWLKSRERWGRENPDYPASFNDDTYNELIDDILAVLRIYGLVKLQEIEKEQIGYLINGSVLEWRAVTKNIGADEQLTGQSSEQSQNINQFFRNLYFNVKNALQDQVQQQFFHQLEAREHTAQVTTEDREEREERFRRGMEKRGLPVLFCSPTMELGVDISTLNMVYMRNVPPTPANYAQRSGRAGRSGQPALIITYCAAKSPHDQYFFAEPSRMAAGAVNPPSIDLANEDLVRSHLNAIWLAETGVQLARSVSGVLDLEREPGLPLFEDIQGQMDTPAVTRRALRRAGRIIDGLREHWGGSPPDWCADSWLENAVRSAGRRFDDSFSRWRSLYRTTKKQLDINHGILNNPASTQRERRNATSRHGDAVKQLDLLLGEERRFSLHSDFYTYRYLAAEGFLPGYNFPRLPLMAFIPGQRQRDRRGDGEFLSRPRFLGLSEFGPQSIIYHEGSTYRVMRAILSPQGEDEMSASAELKTQQARLCAQCGYGHFGDQVEHEHCISCGAPLSKGRYIGNLHRIEQVATRRAFRITSDEEERQRKGYDMVTTLRFSRGENARPRKVETEVSEGGEQLLTLQYSPAATLWRINLGWSRRRERSILGFSMDPSTGEWAMDKDTQAATAVENDSVLEGGAKMERISPFVEDTRNALVIHVNSEQIEIDREMMVSLQYAIKRGVEQEFQLEERELAVEPLPDRNSHNAILLYEASEGGAGVLTRLIKDPEEMRNVARRALEICHFRPVSGGGWREVEDIYGDSKQDEDACEVGCYRCLLSYANQREHEHIDRTNQKMIELLCRLTGAEYGANGSTASSAESPEEMRNISTSSLEREWLEYLEKNRGGGEFSACASAALFGGLPNPAGLRLSRAGSGLHRRPAPRAAQAAGKRRRDHQAA